MDRWDHWLRRLIVFQFLSRAAACEQQRDGNRKPSHAPASLAQNWRSVPITRIRNWTAPVAKQAQPGSLIRKCAREFQETE